jgi:hypothetical protein
MITHRALMLGAGVVASATVLDGGARLGLLLKILGQYALVFRLVKAHG